MVIGAHDSLITIKNGGQCHICGALPSLVPGPAPFGEINKHAINKYDANINNSSIYNFCNNSSHLYTRSVTLVRDHILVRITYTLCVYRYALCMYTCKKAYYPPLYACVDTELTNASFQSSLCDTHIHTHAIPRTHTLTRLLEKGIRIWEGMVLCIRPSLAIGIHQGTLAYICWVMRLECARGREARGGRQSCRHAATCIHT